MPRDRAAAGPILRLLAEVRRDRAALRARSAEVDAFSGPGVGPVPPERPLALALALDRTYTALESILERVARELEGGIPEGGDWHRALLRGAALDIPGVRPPVLREAAVEAADRLRRFRHLIRHAYSADIDFRRAQRLARAWLESTRDVEADLDRFEAFLESLAKGAAEEEPGSGG